jgi:hypothetical protein
MAGQQLVLAGVSLLIVLPRLGSIGLPEKTGFMLDFGRNLSGVLWLWKDSLAKN